MKIFRLGKKRLTLYLCSSILFFAYSGRVLPPLLLPLIEQDLGIGHTQSGFALTMIWVFYGIMQFPSGVLSDYLSPRKIILWGVIIFSTTYLILGFISSYVMLITLLVFVGLGTGMHYTPATSLLSDLFKGKAGKAIGIHDAASAWAGSFAFIIPALALHLGWRGIFIVWAIPGFLIGFLFYQQSYKGTKERTDKLELRKGLSGIRGSLGDKRIYTLFLIYSSFVFYFAGLTSFLPTYLIEVKDFSASISGTVFGLIFVGGALMQPVLSSLVDKYDPRKVLIILASAGPTSLFILTQATSFYLLIPVILLFSASMSFYPAHDTYLIRLLSAASKGGSFGLYRSLSTLLGGFAPAVIGYAADTWDFHTAFFGVSVLLITTTLFLFSHDNPTKEVKNWQ